MHDIHTPPAVTTTIISSVCRKCGAIEKSGKTSCCGRGGSWFRNCGSAGNSNFGHTWYEGIQACKARSQSKSTIGQHVTAAQPKINDSSNDDDTANSKAVSTAVHTFDKPILMTDPATMSTSYNSDTAETRSVTAAANSITSALTPMPAPNSPSNMFMSTPIHTSDSTSIAGYGCEMLLKICDHTSFFLVFVLYLYL